MRLMVMVLTGAGLVAGDALAAPPAKSKELLDKGKEAYSVNCVVCHGEKGDGNGPAGAQMNPKPRDFAKGEFKSGKKPEQVFKSISEGLPGTAMAAFGHLPEDVRWGITYWVLSFQKKPAKSGK